MTRTERSSYPRAINKDRSESRTGLDGRMRKGGAGGHNWGSLQDEIEYQQDEMGDEEWEEEESSNKPGAAAPEVGKEKENAPVAEPNIKPAQDAPIPQEAPTPAVAA